MAITVVQTKQGSTTTGSTLSVVLDAVATAGNRLFAIFAVSEANANVVGPSGWVNAVARNNIGATCSISIWELRMPTVGGEQIITWNHSAAKNSQAMVYEVSGMTTGQIAEDASAFASPAGTTSATTGTTGTTLLASEFAIAGAAVPLTGGAFVSATNSFTNDTPINGLLYPVSKTLSSVGTVETTITWTTSRAPALVICTFRSVDGDPPTPCYDFIT